MSQAVLFDENYYLLANSDVAEAVHISTQYETDFGNFRVSIFVQIVYVYSIAPVCACVDTADGKGRI